jgi:DNA-directed RNA polymerase specialized sigma subunit
MARRNPSIEEINMARRRSALEYPVTIRQVDTYVVFSVKDLNISLIEELPPGGRLTPQFMQRATNALAKSWVKSHERLKVLLENGKPLPEPSKIKVATKEITKTKPLTAPEVAKILGVSKDSVRRIPKAELRFRRTKGGHRRYSIGAVQMYRERFAQAASTDRDV